MLVGAFEVHESRIAQVEVLRQHGAVARARLEPDVEDVPLLAERRPAALRAGGARREQFLDRPGEPGVGSLGAEQVAEMADGLGREQLGVAGRAAQGRDRHAPGPLPADAPVGAERDHRLDPRLAPVRAASGPRRSPSSVRPRRSLWSTRDEPLLGRPEDHRLLAPPAVRIAVHERLLVDRGAPTPSSRSTITRIGREDLLAGQPLRRLGGEPARLVDRAQDRKLIGPAGLVVLGAVAGGRVDQPGAVLDADVAGQHDRADAVDERVAILRMLELPARGTGRASANSVICRRPITLATSSAARIVWTAWPVAGST